MSYTPKAADRTNRYKVSVEEYKHYQKNGYLKVEQLVSPEDVRVLTDWSDDLYNGNINFSGIELGPMADSPDARLHELTRVHMLHRISDIAEWGLLHPRVLDVVEVLEGPDVSALQSMLFFNPPGQGGQGWHQDAHYIPTLPETLVGAWIALDHADEENGCLWVVPESNVEPIYPVGDALSLVHANGAFNDLSPVDHVSHLDDEVNTLSRVVRQYPDPISVPMNPGDVLFFHSHLFHRSHPNRTSDRFRRSYVCHYCNGRSFVPWNHGDSYEGDSANYRHILCRGQTHLPYANPQFGTHVDLTSKVDVERGTAVRMMAGRDNGMGHVQQSFSPRTLDR